MNSNPLLAQSLRIAQMEADESEILESAFSPHDRVKWGSPLPDMGRQAKLTVEECTDFEQVPEKIRATRSAANELRIRKPR